MHNTLTKHFPNTLTCCNLISGSIATMYAFQNEYIMALTLIVIGAIFDFFDGFSARLFHVPSSIGKELDSLADDITFGLAPAAIVFAFLKDFGPCISGFWNFVPYAAFLIAAFSAIRLAKFNLDKRQTSSFIGLATPANALFWGAFVISMHDFLLAQGIGLYLILVLIAISCWLMISEIPMFALKFKSFAFRPNAIRYIFLITSIIIITLFLIIGHSIAGVWIAILWYIVLSLFFGKC